MVHSCMYGQRTAAGWGLIRLWGALRRPESRIAVVSHCGFIFLTLSAFGHECAHNVQEEMHRGFDNCEMRSMVRGLIRRTL